MLTKALATVTREICYNLYQQSPAKVYDYANKVKLLYNPCKGCEAETPTISDRELNTCALCGSVKPKYPTLHKITIDSPRTVIDDVWEGSISKDALDELKRITGLRTYKSILKHYEGFDVEEILETV